MRLPFWRRKVRDEELEEEIQSHLRMAARDRMERGEAAEEARESARREFGNIGLVKEATREMWGWKWLEQLGQDLHYGIRMLMKKPGFALIAVITLALGIGANTAIFSVANVVLLNPFPYPDHSRIYYVYQRFPKLGQEQQFGAFGPDFNDISQSQIFERTAAAQINLSRNLTGGQEPERITAASVSADFFSLLGVNPLLGRAITAADQGPRGAQVLVITYGLWQRQYGGNPDVIGRKVFLDDQPYIIIGVMPPHFFFDDREAFFPFLFDLSRFQEGYGVLARLKPGSSLEQANSGLETIARNQERALGDGRPELVGRGIYLRPIREVYFEQINQVVVVLLCAVGLILLIACANIANLLLARATARTREIALRATLGAGRFRIVRQLLTESLALALLGGAVGVFLALLGVQAIVAMIPPGTIRGGQQINIDVQVLFGAFTVSLISALLFGLWPALNLSKPDLNNALKEGSQTSAGLRHAAMRNILVIFQVAISLVLLVTAGLTVRSLVRLMKIDPGLNPENVLAMRLNIPPAKSGGGQRNQAIFQQFIDGIRTVPGVQSAAAASHIPFDQRFSQTVTAESQAAQGDAQTESVDTRTISTDYLQVMGIRLIEGEGFTVHDQPNAPKVVIINQAMARLFWPNESAIGKRLKPGNPDSDASWVTVKGVVADSAQISLNAPIRPEVYYPHTQIPFCCRRMNLVMRTSVDPASLIGSIKREILSVYKDQPVYEVRTMEEFLARSVCARSSLDACNAGIRANNTPVSSEAASAKPITRTSGLRSSSSGMARYFSGKAACSNLLSHTASMMPPAPPATASRALSVSSCLTMGIRPAPSASLTPISFCLAVALANSRFATFAQAINRTMPDVPISNPVKRRTLSRAFGNRPPPAISFTPTLAFVFG
jgi:putative ABC transport system permease protein